jgi:hypothetical protein
MLHVPLIRFGKEAERLNGFTHSLTQATQVPPALCTGKFAQHSPWLPPRSKRPFLSPHSRCSPSTSKEGFSGGELLTCPLYRAGSANKIERSLGTQGNSSRTTNAPITSGEGVSRPASSSM